MLIKWGPIFFLCWSTVFFTCCAEEIVLWFVQSYEESLWKQNIWNLGQFQLLYLTQGTLATDIKVNSSFLHLIVHNSYQVSWQIQLYKIFAWYIMCWLNFELRMGTVSSCSAVKDVEKVLLMMTPDIFHGGWYLQLWLFLFLWLCCFLCWHFDSHLLSSEWTDRKSLDGIGVKALIMK